MSTYPPVIRRSAVDPADKRLISGLFHGEYSAIIVERAFSAALCGQIVAQIQANGLQRTVRPDFLVAGGLLMFTEDFQQYRTANQSLLAALDELDVLKAIIEQFQRLSTSAEVFTPKKNVPAAPFSVRELRAGGAIEVHSEHDRWPGMEVFRRLLDLSTQLSFYVLLQPAERGGALEFVGPTPLGDQWHIPSPERIPLAVGDLIIFDGGRINHQVSRVEGPRSRWTLGGFASLTKSKVHIWS